MKRKFILLILSLILLASLMLFTTFGEVQSESDIQQDFKSETLYPSDYAGAYLTKDGTLVICLTNVEAIEKYDIYFNNNSILNAEKQVKYIVKPYSFNYLITLQEKLEKKMSEFKIQAISLIQEKNCLILSVKDFGVQKYINDYLSSIGIDLKAVEYQQAEELINFGD